MAGGIGHELGWAHAASSFVSFAGSVATVVVIAVVVRRQRPDAYGALLAWAAGSLALTITMPFVSLILLRLGSVEDMLRRQLWLTLVGIPLHVVLLLVFLRGIVKLAQPPRPVQVENAPPYR